MRRRVGAWWSVLALAAAAGTLGACDDGGGGGSTASFCGRVEEQREQLFGRLTDPVTPEVVQDHIDLVTDVGDVAPLEIEADWDAWTAALDAQLNGTDAEDVKAMAYAAQESAGRINTWLQSNCGFDVGVALGTVPALGVTTTIAVGAITALPIDTIPPA